MCSIFGFIRQRKSSDRTPAPLEILERIIRANIARGPHAFGFAWVTPDGRIRAYKQEGNLVSSLPLIRMASDAIALVGHLRYATHGDPSNNINNHPHPIDGGWLVHNGVVSNYEELVEEHDLPVVSNCDSEAIALMAEREDGKMLPRVVDAIEHTEGCLAIASLWARPTRMIIARSGNPLSISTTHTAKFFATLPVGLPGTTASVKDNTAVQFTYGKDGTLNAEVSQIRRVARRHVSTIKRGFWFTDDDEKPTGAYRGG